MPSGSIPRSLKITSGAIPIIDDVAPNEFTLSASGSALYSLNADRGAGAELVLVSLDGKAEPLDSSWRADFVYPALSPDGKALAVSVRDGPTQLWIQAVRRNPAEADADRLGELAALLDPRRPIGRLPL